MSDLVKINNTDHMLDACLKKQNKTKTKNNNIVVEQIDSCLGNMQGLLKCYLNKNFVASIFHIWTVGIIC